uniref:I/LWEQ domain-containing protein n=1 Tax=Macrostomum lignano TaxID=282301 RepID=A0A1I8FHD8_9PLAT
MSKSSCDLSDFVKIQAERQTALVAVAVAELAQATEARARSQGAKLSAAVDS